MRGAALSHAGRPQRKNQCDTTLTPGLNRMEITRCIPRRAAISPAKVTENTSVISPRAAPLCPKPNAVAIAGLTAVTGAPALATPHEAVEAACIDLLSLYTSYWRREPGSRRHIPNEIHLIV